MSPFRGAAATTQTTKVKPTADGSDVIANVSLDSGSEFSLSPTHMRVVVDPALAARPTGAGSHAAAAAVVIEPQLASQAMLDTIRLQTATVRMKSRASSNDGTPSAWGDDSLKHI